MKVRWDYEGTLTYQHTVDETEDPECHLPQTVSVMELIVHAANLHLFKSMGHTPAGHGLWSCSNRAPSVDEPVRSTV